MKEWVKNGGEIPISRLFVAWTVSNGICPVSHPIFVISKKRIGEKGREKIFRASIEIHGMAVQETEIIVDTTVQEKNITFPTDTKLRVKVIARCWKISEEEKITLRRSYKRELKGLLRTIRINRARYIKAKTRPSDV